MGRRIENFKINRQISKDNTVASIRKHWLRNWMEYSGVDDPEEIDYENPFVKIEWLLSDPLWLHAIKNEKGRQEFKERLNDPLAWWIFCNYKPEDGGKSYWDHTEGNLVIQMQGAYRHMRRRKDGTSTR